MVMTVTSKQVLRLAHVPFGYKLGVGGRGAPKNRPPQSGVGKLKKSSVVRHEYKDDFHWIRVVDEYPEKVRYLHFEDSIQGAIYLGDHHLPVFEYVGLMAKLAPLGHSQPGTILMGGLGSGGLLHALRRRFGKTVPITTVECNPLVYQLTKQFFRVDPSEEVVLDDIRSWMEQSDRKTWDLIFLDCYNAYSIPPHLTSVEFWELVFTNLSDEGAVVANFWSPTCNELCGDQVRTVLEVFDAVGMITCHEDQNLVLLGSKKKSNDPARELSFKQRPYDFQKLFPQDSGQWPSMVRNGRVMTDANLNKFFDAIGLFL